jgi:hypothetical protein
MYKNQKNPHHNENGALSPPDKWAMSGEFGLEE